MSTPATSHVDPLFVPVFGEAIELLRKVLLTKVAQPFVVAGSGTLGWDMMVNLIERDDEVLVINTGYFGDKFGEWYVLFFGYRSGRHGVRQTWVGWEGTMKLLSWVRVYFFRASQSGCVYYRILKYFIFR
jgi:hypothetical protein